jgi:septum formation protein
MLPPSLPQLGWCADFPLVVGSVSPRRHTLLRQCGLPFEVCATDASEIHDASDPVGTVVHNALAKQAACQRLRPAACLLTADTLVLFGERLIGKPRDLDEAAQFLRAFSGRTQTVYTAVALTLPGTAPATRVEASAVHFRTLSAATIQEYLHRTRPLDRAGAYDIDENGEMLIAGYGGSYTNIMGLPMETVCDWFLARGVARRADLLPLAAAVAGRPHDASGGSAIQAYPGALAHAQPEKLA